MEDDGIVGAQAQNDGDAGQRESHAADEDRERGGASAGSPALHPAESGRPAEPSAGRASAFQRTDCRPGVHRRIQTKRQFQSPQIRRVFSLSASECR